MNIDNTNLDSGLEYLPDSLKEFYCTDHWALSRVKILEQELKRWGEANNGNFICLLRIWKQANVYLVFRVSSGGNVNFQQLKSLVGRLGHENAKLLIQLEEERSKNHSLHQRLQEFATKLQEHIQETKDELGVNERDELAPLILEDTQNWQNIHSSLVAELQSCWQSHGFTYQQTKDWISIGLTPRDYLLAHFLKSTKNLTPEEVLNHHSLENLKVEFEQSQRIPQIIHNPPRNN